MKTLRDLEQGTIVTVSRVSGSKEERILLEKLGVMPGADLTMLGEADGGILVDNDRREVVIPDSLLDNIKFSDQFKRNRDPIFVGGLCAGGDTSGFFQRYEKAWEESDKQFAAPGGQQS